MRHPRPLAPPSGELLGRPLGGLTALALGLLLGGCTAEPFEEPTSVRERLRECGMLTEGVAPPLPSRLFVPDGCYDDCLGGGRCEELRDLFCGADIALAVRCDARCAYRCPDGELLAPTQECDGIEQCEGGADELGCPTDDGCAFSRRCDGEVECLDGRDERGCERFVCGDGREIPARERCDGWARCDDESDEAGCAEYTVECTTP